MLLVKILPFKIINFFKKIYLKVKKVPNNITPQQANIAEKIPVLIKVDFLLAMLFRIFKFERCI